MLFSNLLVALALTALFPLGLMGMLAASEWLERRTLATEEVVPRRLRRMDSKPPEAVEAMVLEETAQVVAEYWSATGRPASSIPVNGDQQPAVPQPRATVEEQPAAAGSENGSDGGGRHLRRPPGGRAGRHERRR
jgi:hypothetical protein